MEFRYISVSSIREARYVEAYIRFVRSDPSWYDFTVPEKAKEAISRCNERIRNEFSDVSSAKETQLMIAKRIADELLPESEFDWIKSGGNGAVELVLRMIRQRGSVFTSITSLSGMDLIYTYYDLITLADPMFNRMAKLNDLRELRRLWGATSDFKWLEKMTHEEWVWAMRYLEKTRIYPADIHTGIRGINTEDLSGVKNYVHERLQNTGASPAQQELFIKKMKNALSSKKNRQKGETINIQVDETRAIELLELAEHHDCSKAKMIERLIKWEYQKLKSDRSI